MGWYSEIGAAAWRFRAAVSVVHTNGSATPDLQFDVPLNWDHFWDADHLLSTGLDIRLVAADGETKLNYKINSFNQATRTAQIEVKAVDLLTDARVYLLWIYYGNDTAADGQAAFAVAAPETSVFVELSIPSTHRIRIRPPLIGNDRPGRRLQKGTAESLYVGFEIASLLQRRVVVNARSRRYEEPFLVRVRVQQAAVDVAAMVDGSRQRFVEDRGQLWAFAYITGGTEGDYTLLVEIRTHVPTETAHRLLEPHVLLRVKDQSEA